METDEHPHWDKGSNWCWGAGSRSRRGGVALLASAHCCSGSASLGIALSHLFSLGSLTHTQLSTVCLTLLHQDMFFLFNLSSFILQFCSQAVCLKLIGRFFWKQSVSWLITTSQVFARVNHSSLSLLSCLRQCWFSPLKLWIKDPSNHVNIKYSSIVTEQPQFYPNI